MSIRVLIVDDNRELAENLAEILEDEGYRVRTFERAVTALNSASDEPFDAALLDVCMPDMGGVELHDRLRALCPSATYVMMSAFTAEPRLQGALREGSFEVTLPGAPRPAQTHFLLKPFAPGSLLALLSGGVAASPRETP